MFSTRNKKNVNFRANKSKVCLENISSKGHLGSKTTNVHRKKNGMEELKIAAVLVFCVGLANLLLGLSKHPITGQNIPEWAKNPR